MAHLVIVRKYLRGAARRVEAGYPAESLHSHCVLFAGGLGDFLGKPTCLDADGHEFRCSRTIGDLYKANQLLDNDDPKKLPDPNAFHFGAMPPPAVPTARKSVREAPRPAA